MRVQQIKRSPFLSEIPLNGIQDNYGDLLAKSGVVLSGNDGYAAAGWSTVNCKILRCYRI